MNGKVRRGDKHVMQQGNTTNRAVPPTGPMLAIISEVAKHGQTSPNTLKGVSGAPRSDPGSRVRQARLYILKDILLKANNICRWRRVNTKILSK